MINNFFCSHILYVLVWKDAKTLGVAEGVDGVVIETGIVDAILQVWMFVLQFMIPHFMSFRFSGSWARDSYLWSMHSAARLKMNQPLWGICRQNYCWDHYNLKTMSFVFGWRLLRLQLDCQQHNASTTLKKRKEKKIIYYVFVFFMFLLLCRSWQRN